MGFGAGFGPAFAASFNQQRERVHERETDNFRYRMETLLKKKDKYDEYKAQDAKHANLAKEIVQNTNAPPEAVGKAYGMLRDGATYDDVMKVFSTRKFKVTKGADEQTQDALAPADSTAPAPAAPAPGLDGGGLLSQVFPGMKKFKGGGTEQRVQDTTGMSAEEIAQIDAGYTPPEMNTGEVSSTPIQEPTNDVVEAKRIYDEAAYALKANPSDPELQAAADSARRQFESVTQGTGLKAKAGGFGQSNTMGSVEVVIPGATPDEPAQTVLAEQTADGFTTADGTPLPNARTKTEDELKLADDISNRLMEPVQKHEERVKNLSQAYTSYGIARQIIKDNPMVLQEGTAGWDQFLVGLGKDFAAGAELLSSTLADPEAAAASGDISEIEAVGEDIKAAMDNPALSEPQKLAAAKGLLNVQYAIGAYHIAAAKGQEGKALDKEERKMFTNLPNQAMTPEDWDHLIGSLLVPEKQALDQEAKSLPSTHPRFEYFKSTYKYSPVGKITSVEDYLKGEAADLDRELPQGGYKAVVPQKEEVPKKENEKPAEYPGYTYTGKLTPDGKKLYKDAEGNIGTMD